MADEKPDYMGDLSQFLTHENSQQPPKKDLQKQLQNQFQSSSKKKNKILNWQKERMVKREQKQKEEDLQTLVNCCSALPPSNRGFKLLQQMGYNPGSALGKEGQGRVEPVGIEIKRSRAGLGVEEARKSKAKRKDVQIAKNRKKEEELMVEFGYRQKNQWRNRKIFVDYQKAQAALTQLENTDIVELEKKDGEEEDKEEEEEEEITAEDLHVILIKLREEHHYCLYCGCQYESAEALLSSCPGTEEEDH